jgi:hypothetical protein
MLHKMRTGTFCHKLARRQVQQYWWKNLERWSLGRSIGLCRSILERHVGEGFPIGVGRILGVRLLPFRAASRPYLPFALSTSVPFG